MVARFPLSRVLAPAALRLLLAGLFVATLTLALLRAIPGDPSDRLGTPDDPTARRAAARAWSDELSLPQALLEYAAGVLQGDLGRSLSYRRPVGALLAEALPRSLVLAVAAVGCALLGATFLSYFVWRRAARPVAPGRRGIELLIAMLGVMPRFWLGVLLVLLFHDLLGWLPASHIAPAGAAAGGIQLAHAVLPTLTLALPLMALLARVLLAGIAQPDAVHRARAATSLGLTPPRIFALHLLAPQWRTGAAALGAELPLLLSGAAMVETVFSWPGLGQLAAEAIGSADAPLAMASVLLGALTATCGGVLTSLGADRNRPQRGQA